MRLKQLVDGQWELPVLRGYRLACCNCGLVHRMDFRLVIDEGQVRPSFRLFRLPKRKPAKRRRRRKA